MLNVCPRKFHSMLGIMRSAPSRKPMYQSGWDPAVIWGVGVYGPYSQIGLIVDERGRAGRRRRRR